MADLHSRGARGGFRVVHDYRGETRTASQVGVEKDARGRIGEEGELEEDDQWEEVDLKEMAALRSGGGGGGGGGTRAATAASAVTTEKYSWLGQGVVAAAARRCAAAAAAAAMAVGLLPRPSVSSHSRWRRLLFFFSNDG